MDLKPAKLQSIQGPNRLLACAMRGLQFILYRGLFAGPQILMADVPRYFFYYSCQGPQNIIEIMNSKFSEPILNEPITNLGLSTEFCLVCEIAGFYTLADLLEHHTSKLLKLPGFNYHMLCEYVNFLENKRIGHYIDRE